MSLKEARFMKRQVLTLITGMSLGAILFGGASAASAGVMAEPSWSPIYVDGEQASISAAGLALSKIQRVDVKKQRRSSALITDLGVENVCFAVRQLKLL